MFPTELLWGPLVSSPQVLPLRLTARLCDLRPRFLPKGRVGRGYRAIARNGRVLFASDRPLAEWVDQPAQLRLQTWHRALLPGAQAEPYGILLCVHGAPAFAPKPTYAARLIDLPDPSCAVALDLGGRLVLEFRRMG